MFLPGTEAQHIGVAMRLFKELHFGVDPHGFRRVGGANDDEISRVAQRDVEIGAEVSRSREFIPIAKNRKDPTRDYTIPRFRANERRWYFEALERLVKPLRFFAVNVTVADKSPVAFIRAQRGRIAIHDGSS